MREQVLGNDHNLFTENKKLVRLKAQIITALFLCLPRQPGQSFFFYWGGYHA